MVDLPTEQVDARKWRIAPRLREARQKQSPKLSQAGLARRVSEAGLSYFQPAHASRLECGYLDATWSEVQALARALGVSESWLADRKAEPTQAVTPARAEIPAGAVIAATPAAAPNAPTTPPPTVAHVAVQESPDPTMPPPDLLEQGNRSAHEFRQSLVDTLARATAMLHQPGLPARSWRAWRDVDRLVRERLRQVAID